MRSWSSSRSWRTFGSAKVDLGELPLFPSLAGCFVEKRHVVSSIEAVAKLVGEPLEDSRGVRRFGGHSLRVTGARTLAELGPPSCICPSGGSGYLGQAFGALMAGPVLLVASVTWVEALQPVRP